MEADLILLEEKLNRLLALCQQLRAENAQLRQSLAQAQDEAGQLKSNMALAGQRLKALIDRLPQDETSGEAL
jgi:cell division protein ZapB